MKKRYFILALLCIGIFSLASAETYTSELQDAYTYAHGLNITTQSSIDTANMYGSLIRSHMAKMIVGYAEGVLGKTPDPSKDCLFTDMDNQSEELKAYVTEACQLGLMGVGITAFNPNDIITRAQFGTVLSRALYDDAYNGGNPYYVDHLQALKDAGIMKNVSTPNVPEIRGYVMLMMMRAGESGDTTPPSISQCESSENQVLCAIGSPNCPMECQAGSEITTFAGVLVIASVSSSIDPVPSGTKYVGSLKFTANDEDITIKSITFKKTGIFTEGWIEDDGAQIALLNSLSTDATTTASFPLGIYIKK